MRWRIQLFTGLLILVNTEFLKAQRVLYSPYLESRSATHFEVAGRAGDYYWVQQERLGRPPKGSKIPREEQGFQVYDSRMNPVRSIAPTIIPDSVTKEYLICGTGYFDRLMILTGPQKTNLWLERFTSAGLQLNEGRRLIASFPFSENGNSFLMARSEDQQRILVLCFQSIPSSPPLLHALLFDADWTPLYDREYEHPFITQPFLQDDFISYPAEHYNNSPIKLANSGQWMMLSPSRTNHNYLLLHFTNSDTGIVCKEIPLPPGSGTEDLALSIDNGEGAAFAGVLSKFRYPALKNVEVVHYRMDKMQFDFDSSYRFSTLTGAQVKTENLVHESFLAIPKKGFLLLKEYGRTYDPSPGDLSYEAPWDIEALFTNNSIAVNSLLPLINLDGYTRFSKLGGTRQLFERGDLNLFYFPTLRGDSCWSGIIDKEQVTEFNSPYLSYFTLPVQDRIFFFYNSIFRNQGQFGSTTILDDQGNEQDEGGGAFWKFNNMLDFQQSRQITVNEIAVPYANYRRNGFAVIRF
jgi:hypothetical protein